MSPEQLDPARLAERGKQAYAKKLYAEALEDFLSAHKAYAEAEDELNTGEMSNNLAVTLLNLDRPQEALEYVQGTPELFLAHKDDSRAAMAFGNLALALDATGDRKGAVDALYEAIDRFRQLGDNENLMVTTKVLSELQLRQGQAIDAVQTMQGGLDSQKGLNLRYRLLRKILSIPSRILGR